MSELKEMVLDVFNQMLRDNVTKQSIDQLEAHEMDETLWHVLIDNDMHLVAWEEQQGGAGGDIEDLLSLYRMVGQYAAPVPFVEHTLANYILQQVGLQPYYELITISLEQVLKLQEQQLFGTLQHVPWASFSQYVVTIANEQYERYIVVVRTSEASLEQSQNIAGEPRDTMHFNDVTVIAKIAITDAQLRIFTKFITASYIARMAGAMATIKSLSVQFSKERHQFGRPIHRFQLVQQHIACIAGEEALMNAACENMILSLSKNKGTAEVAFARIRMDDASKIIATGAHQLHAAIGVTYEHRLQHFTRRLWAWRDEGYPAKFWIEKLVSTQLAANANIWEAITKQ